MSTVATSKKLSPLAGEDAEAFFGGYFTGLEPCDLSLEEILASRKPRHKEEKLEELVTVETELSNRIICLPPR